MSDPGGRAYARHGCVEGLLQRGRGLGALRARCADPRGAAGWVYDGVRRDWRWDQVDDRSWYLAWLVRELELPRGPVIDQLAGDEEASAR